MPESAAVSQSWLRLVYESRKLKRFLAGLAARRALTRDAALSPFGEMRTSKAIEFRLKAEAERGRTYLDRCCEAVLDAHTVENAIFWHCEIITELTVEMHAVEAGKMPPAAKVSTTAMIEERIRYHGILLDRLTGVLQRNEQVVWQP